MFFYGYEPSVIQWEFPVNSEELPGKSSQIQGKRT